jgi:hypothetical protein
VAAFSALNARGLAESGCLKEKNCMATSTPIDLGTETVVIILVGLIASGKVCSLTFCQLGIVFWESHPFLAVGLRMTSPPPGQSTFAEALQRYIPQIRRCNQDELGDRRSVEDLSRDCLWRGLSVCIDRTNLDST